MHGKKSTWYMAPFVVRCEQTRQQLYVHMRTLTSMDICYMYAIYEYVYVNFVSCGTWHGDSSYLYLVCS